MEVKHTNKSYYLIVDVDTGQTLEIKLEPAKGVLRQVNEAYDNYVKEVDNGREEV